MDHLQIVEPSPRFPDVALQVQEEKKLAAIKAYREATGVSWAEARDAVKARMEKAGTR
jgi:ribosomal protein L7/L12